MADGFFQGLSRLGRLHPNARPARHGLEVERDVPYLPDGSAEHLLDVYRPVKREGPLPALLYLHGGGFRILSKDSHWVMCLAFARRGLVVFNANYRLGPRHKYPAAHQDACAALEWVADNAARFGADPERLLIAGESAGANLTAALTLACCFPRPEPWARRVFDVGLSPLAALPACGMFQLSDPARFWRQRPMSVWLRDRLSEPAMAYLGGGEAGGSADPPVPAGLADPLLILEGDEEPDRPLPPFFAPVGTKDPLLPDTRRLKAALDRRGVPCQVQYYPGEIHAFHALVWRKNARRCWRDTYRFLAEVLG